MASTTITVPDDKVTRILDAFEAEFPGRAEAGMTKVQWFKFQLIQYIKQTVKNHEGNIAAGSARLSNENDVNSIDIT